MKVDSIWRTWKPYVAIPVVVGAALWWYSTQASFAVLKDGSYECQPVYVNEAGKYESLVDSAGNAYTGSATVEDGELVGLVGEESMSPDQLATLTMRKRGRSHFHVTDEQVLHSYNAAACDYSGE